MKNHELSSHELRFFQSHWCHWWPFWIRVLKFQFHSITSDPLIQYWSDVMLSEIWLELQFLEHKLVVNSSELGHNSWLTSIYLSISLSIYLSIYLSVYITISQLQLYGICSSYFKYAYVIRPEYLEFKHHHPAATPLRLLFRFVPAAAIAVIACVMFWLPSQRSHLEWASKWENIGKIVINSD